MKTFNFTAVVLHPNTEQMLADYKSTLLAEKYQNYFPVYPLFGLIKNTNFSKDLKKYFSDCNKISINGFFEADDILIFSGFFSFSKDSSKADLSFLIPFGVNKKRDSKKLPSLFQSLSDLLPDNNKIINMTEISFKSFQIADCHLADNEYNIYESFWTKIST